MTTINCFGDSLTVGQDALPYNYPNFVASALNVSVNNLGINGSQLADQMPSIFSTALNDSFLLTGFNDARFYGSCVQSYIDALQSSIVYLSCSNLVKAINMGGSGGWNITGVYGGNLGQYTSTLNNYLYTIITGSVIYICGIKLINGAGTFNVNIDGTIYGPYSCNGFQNTYSNISYGPFVIRIAGLTNTAHSVIISSNGDGNTFINYIASPNGSGNRLVLGECLKMNAIGYALAAPTWNHSSDAVVSAYNTEINNQAAAFAADGCNVSVAHMEYDPNRQADSGNIHPTAYGHMVIASNFIKAYNPSW